MNKLKSTEKQPLRSWSEQPLRSWFLKKTEYYTPELLEELAFGIPNCKDFNLIAEVAQYIPRAQGGFTRQQGILFIIYGQYKVVKENLDKFDNLKLDRELCLELVNNYDDDGREVILENFHDFQGIDKEIISKIINQDPRLVIKYWDRIPHFGLDNELFDKLYIQNKTLLMDNLFKFKGLGNDQFIRLLEDSWYCHDVVSNFDCFKLNVNNALKQQIQELINNNQDDLKYSLALAKVGQLLFPNKTLEGGLKKISSISNREQREQKKQALVEFKEFLAEYLKNWSEITSFIITILRTQPDISEEEFLSQIVTQMRQRKLEPLPFQAQENDDFIVASLEYVEIKSIFRLIKEMMKTTNKLRADYPKDEDLFEYLYGRKPNGKVKFEETLGSFYIICEDSSDYILVYKDINLADDPKAESKISKKDKDRINRAGGVSVYCDKIDWWLTAQQGMREEAPIREKIFKHEMNHLLRNYVFEILRQLSAKPIIISDRNRNRKITIEGLLQEEHQEEHIEGDEIKEEEHIEDKIRDLGNVK